MERQYIQSPGKQFVNSLYIPQTSYSNVQPLYIPQQNSTYLPQKQSYSGGQIVSPNRYIPKAGQIISPKYPYNPVVSPNGRSLLDKAKYTYNDSISSMSQLSPKINDIPKNTTALGYSILNQAGQVGGTLPDIVSPITNWFNNTLR